ncbi:FAD/NAD(P)-binding domain-containing protein [Xylaria bambusicola]|uniref:FAD/NAD(P)-binding domain-containing protein n=1 Tax=Xylaria bambusicola TaxID=326684 RepID=UPI0020087975|nr:FAD/NAD(P)-binding domain-containing protein [Xylaria bambusicola]KAI0502856.1 FAD/NAD(P)-binding domain-containing protein [Xylaria bambusicola]
MLFTFVIGLLASVHATNRGQWGVFENNEGQWSEVVERDVCIVGGGASGVHAAVSLVDLNKTVVVVERRNRLGGDTHTYMHPETGGLVDIGVVIFQPLQAVFDFFKKLDLPLLNLSAVTTNTPGQPANTSQPAFTFATLRTYLDFRDGSNITRPTVTDEEVAEAFRRMSDALSPYDYILHGYDLPDPVPEDLFMPYGAFVEKYNLSAAFQIVYQISQGMGDLLHIPTIYAAKYFNRGDITALTQGYLTHARGNNSEIYSRAGDYISTDNVMLESTVVSSRRQKSSTTNASRAELLVSTRNEGLKLLSCSQIILAIPPELSNLAGWDLTEQEQDVFSSFISANGYWTGLVKNVGLNQTLTSLNGASNTPFNIPVLPALYALSPVGIIDDVWSIKFGANMPTMLDDQVKSYVEREIQTIQHVQNATVTQPEWLIFESHAPFHLQVSPEDIRGGFFKRLNALQGSLDGTMFYTGAAFHTHHSSLLWRFNREVLLPKMMEYW